MRLTYATSVDNKLCQKYLQNVCRVGLVLTTQTYANFDCYLTINTPPECAFPVEQHDHQESNVVAYIIAHIFAYILGSALSNNNNAKKTICSSDHCVRVYIIVTISLVLLR